MINSGVLACGETLFKIAPAYESVEKSRELLNDTFLKEALENPTVTQEEKYSVIKKLFPKDMRAFVCIITSQGYLKNIGEIFDVYENLYNSNNGIIKAKLYYVTKPSDEIAGGFKKALAKRFNAKTVIIELEKDSDLIGGYVLEVGDIRFDKSVKGSLDILKKKLVRR